MSENKKPNLKGLLDIISNFVSGGKKSLPAQKQSTERSSKVSKNDAKLKPETLALHGGQEADPTTGSRAVPIYQTTWRINLRIRITPPIFLGCVNSGIFIPV
jgi:hypothetical protein